MVENTEEIILLFHSEVKNNLSESIVLKTEDFLKKLVKILADNNINLQKPSFSLDESNNVVIEWNIRKPKKLTIFIKDDEISYLESWGISIINDMSDGAITSKSQILNLYKNLTR